MKLRLLNLCSPWHIATVFRPEVWAEFSDACIVVDAASDADADEQIPACDAAMTGWGTSYVFTAARLDSAPRLRSVIHTAGTIKHLFPDADARAHVTRNTIAVYSGSLGLSLNVAEATIGMLILGMRHWPELASEYKANRNPGIAQPSDTVPRNGRYLIDATIGIVGLSSVAHLVLPLLRAFGCRVLAYDPYVGEAEGRKLGVDMTSLDDLFARSDAVSIHAPALPETKGLVGARQLRLLRDGCTLVNTARGMILDHDALAAECGKGRINAVLDVTDPEPLPAESPLWDLPTVHILPHVAGMGHAGLFQIGDGALAALRAQINGSLPNAGLVDFARWEKIA